MAEDFSGSPEKPLKRRGTEEAEDREWPDNHETQVIENGFLPQGEKQTLPRMNADLEARITAEARRNLHSINIEVMWSRTTAIFRLSFVMKSVAAASLFLLVHCLVAQQSPAGRKGFQWNWRKSEELTAKQTLAATKGISAEEKEQIVSALAVKFKGDPKSREEATQTRIKLVDLNGDGIPEVIAQPVNNDYCSPTGNCPFWVFQKTAAGYKQLLDKGSVQIFTIQPTQTNGFYDLVLGMHGSATQQELFVYRFREGRYRHSACYDANWSYLGKDNEYHDLKEPRITPCGK